MSEVFKRAKEAFESICEPAPIDPNAPPLLELEIRRVGGMRPMDASSLRVVLKENGVEVENTKLMQELTITVKADDPLPRITITRYSCPSDLQLTRPKKDS